MISVIHPHLIDINTSHNRCFRFEKFGHQTENLIMCFCTPAEILTRKGMETAGPGDCIIHSLDFHLLHFGIKGANEGFCNDWLYVKPEPLELQMKILELPWDTLIHTADPEIIRPHLKNMKHELIINDGLSEHAIKNQLNNMLLAIARTYRRTRMMNDEMTVMQRRYYPEFVILRRNMLEHCNQNCSLKVLAEKVHLSLERFTALYRQFFNSAPYSELIDARIVRAKRLLAATDIEIKEISMQCGWDDIHYFSRIFKRKTGMAPTQFRKSNY